MDWIDLAYYRDM